MIQLANRVENTVQLSIIIPSHSRTDLLTRCIASVQRHAPGGTELVVVDDASVDACVSAAASRFKEVAVIRLPRRRGFCTAVNAGVAAARNEVIELLNDDTEVLSGWAEHALEWFRDPIVGAVAPLVLAGPDADRIDSAGDRYFVGGVAAKRDNGKPENHAVSQAETVFAASGSSAFYRRDALIKVGGYPEIFGAYFDDIDVAFRLQRFGWRTIHEPASRVIHQVSASYGRPEGSLLEQQSLNEERVFWRNLPAQELVRALPMHMAVIAGKACRRWREGTLGHFLRGRLRILSEIRQIIDHRRMLKKLGRPAPVEFWGVEREYWF